ncbi:MAG: pentapeptide repeat-containing protein [Proteobacteria bacterium]|nr:pentapeptide repeat-containing protein [Pseudomonadota bacterium]MBI3496399.1 pentapeptide repeat-containing protein [Pseudomonadota bacterium]
MDARDFICGAEIAGDIHFENVQFENGLDLTNTVFAGKVTFKKCRFMRDVLFEATTFAKDITLLETTTTHGGIFRPVLVGESVTLQGQLHSKFSIDLRSREIQGNLYLTGVDIDGDVLLDRAKVQGDLLISGTCRGPVSLVRTCIRGRAQLVAHFVNEGPRPALNISHARFYGKLEFSGTWSGIVRGVRSIFEKDVNLERIEARKICSFYRAQFKGPVTVSGAFQDNVRLNRAHFARSVTFVRDTAFRGQVRFDRAVFDDRAIFQGVLLEGFSDFRDCKFAVAPEFHGARLHPGTSFSVGRHFWRQFQDIKSDGAEAAYQTLKKIRREHEAHRDEQLFFVMELRCRSVKERGIVRIFAQTYGLFSLYGQSIARPIAWLAGVGALLGATVYRIGFDSVASATAETRMLAHIHYTLRQTLPVLYPFTGSWEALWKTTIDEAVKVVPIMPTVAALHALFSSVLLFLLLLALKNRFKMQ